MTALARPLAALLLAALALLIPGSMLAGKPPPAPAGGKPGVEFADQPGARASAPVVPFVPGSAPSYGERILSYGSDILVGRDGALDVTETIRVRAEGTRIQRGIYRDFPTRYYRGQRRVRVTFDVQSVQRNGRDEPYSLESIGNGERVRIGDANVMLDRGEHTYVIRYRTERQLGFFDSYDELYWNVTGNDWAFPIDVADVRIRLPSPSTFGQRAVYTGPQGATATNAEVVSEQPGEIRFRTTRPLAEREGLTVAVSWPKGIVTAPPPPSAAARWLERFAPVWAALLSLIALGFFYFHAWRVAGRGPVPGTIVPLFAPPEGMSAAAARYVRRMGFDNRAFAAAIVESGVRGKIRLEEGPKGWFSKATTTIHKTAEPEDMPAPERAMLRKLLGGRSQIEMKQSNHATFTAARDGMRKALETQYLGSQFKTNKGWAWAGLVLIGVAMLIVALVMYLTDTFLEPAAALLPIGGLAFAGLSLWLGRGSRLASPDGTMLHAVLAIACAAFAFALLFAAFGLAMEATTFWPMLAPLLILPLAFSAFVWMAAPTPEGRATMDAIAGFQKYLSATEESRLEVLHPPEKTPELFERYLPYAIALGVENRWAKRFESVLAVAARTPGQDGSRPMGWYSGSQTAWSNPSMFAAAVGGALTSSVASASTAPGSSSGSGGGGSSGGGGGGGGGGGW